MTPKEIQALAQKLRISNSENKFETDLEETLKKIEEEYSYTITIEEIGTDIRELIKFSGKSGSVERKAENNFLIKINPYDIELRKRFTTAHELGHIVLGHLEVGLTVEEQTVNIMNRTEIWYPDDSREKDANRFAAELLMPENLMREFFGDSEIDFSLIEQATKKFNVSKSAIMTRLNFLNLRF